MGLLLSAGIALQTQLNNEKTSLIGKKVRVRGLKRRSRALIRASLVEESELDPEEILDGVH